MNDLLNFTGISDSARNGAASDDSGLERATFAAGCFWGVEASFREIEGVVRTRVGYTGGRTADPSYEQVCSDGTGHAEAIEVWFDPARWSATSELLACSGDPRPDHAEPAGVGLRQPVPLGDLLPRCRSRSGSRIASRDERQAELRRPIVTEIVPASPFYDAEEYHQRYFEKHGGACLRDHAVGRR